MVKPGMFIGDRYEIISKIGTGGMADVYKARCHRLNRFVAIKILKQEYSEDKKFVDKFRAEAQSAAGLSHPNIVNVYDVGEDDGLYYIVMELVEGITLKSFIERKGKLEIKEATGITIQIAQGVEAAHANHIIHRDIKPQNIIISREGKVKVTDFGIAKAASSNTITSNAMGSVHYISPEQARGGYSDEKSDIYSLGVTLYEMLTGQVPFVGDNTVSVALSHIQDEATPVRSLNSAVTPSLDKIVQKCMQKKPERRYLTASALIEDLKKSIANPEGDFVQLMPTLVDDSPTINLSEEEVSSIRRATKHTAPIMTDKESEINMDDDDENEKELDPKLEKIAIVGGIAAAIIMVIIIIFLIAKLIPFKSGTAVASPSPTPSISPSPTVEETQTGVTVPKFIGMTQEVAENTITEMGLLPKVVEEASELYEKGLVCGQNPAQNDTIEEGGTVELVVSTGPDETVVVVPEVAGKALADAQYAITLAGLSATKSSEEFNDSVEAGKVIRTVPAAGTSLDRDSSVSVVVSKGKETKVATVPDLSGLTEKKALAKLIEKGLTGEVKEYKYDDTIKQGKVISQSHSSGTQVEEGTKVTFIVSLGPEATYSYEASFTITENPFTYEEEEGTLSVVLAQDGKSWEVYNDDVNYYSFPMAISFEGKSDSIGEISLYLDDEKFGSTHSVSFTKVTQ
ncbi:MAG: Stk1 family PASTA domain-containing Ser/Thr kinase [Velocimicrobium sp.]